MAYIKEHIRSVDAVLILANSTVIDWWHGLRTPHSVDHLAQTATNNIGFVFTNARPPFDRDFSQDTVPEAFKGAPQFVFDNPIAISCYESNESVPFT
jgi:hypothetical protein